MKQVRTLQNAINRLLNANIAVDGIFGKQTALHYNLLVDKLSKWLIHNFDGFLIIRMSDEFDNSYSDFAFYLQGKSIKEVLPCTSKAGKYWIYNPITYGGITGTAVLKAGLYPKSWEGVITYRFGFKSFELIQVRPFDIYRDNNRDNKIDKSRTQNIMAGINMHTGGWITLVDRWSAGCIVVPEPYWSQWCNEHFELKKLYDVQLIEWQ